MTDEPKAGPFDVLEPDRRPAASKAALPKGSALGRWRTFNAFVDIHGGGLTPAAYRTWITLFRDSRRNGTARASQAYVARRAGLSVRAIRNAIRELVDAGLLTVVHRGHSGSIGVYRAKASP